MSLVSNAINFATNQSANSAVSAATNWNNLVNSGSTETYDYLSALQSNAAYNNQYSANQAALQRDWQVQQNAKAMDFNASEAAKNRNWQEIMSNTAHQREVKDLVAAGLNPVLSATGGNGASTGSGSTASGVTSSGSKGDVDISVNNALVNILGTMLDNKNAIDIANINAKTNMAVAEKYTATSELVQSMINAQQRYMAQNYPSSMFGSISALVNGLSHGLGFGSAASGVTSAAKDVKSWFDDKSHYQSSTGFGEWLYKVLHPKS